MGSNKFFHGSSLLLGDNTIPGVSMPEELKVLLPTIYRGVTDFGCDYYPTVVQMLSYDQISEVAAYGGFPVRYPHWKWGMEYEELQRGYEHGMHRIYEMVINTNPVYIYCLDSNTLVDNVTVVAHALGHADFFKNNIYFTPTSQNMMNKLANHGTRIRRYMQRWGKDRVSKFLDHVLRLETLIDPAKAWDTKKVKDVVISDRRIYSQPNRLSVRGEHDYMDEYVNPKEWKDIQREKMERQDTAKDIGVFQNPTKDILGYLRNNAPLKPWQQDIIAMIHEESMYFAPQRITKVANEGWASFIDYQFMMRDGFIGLGQPSVDSGIVEYAAHKAGVLGGKYSMNPYKLGFYLFLDIEERWNKGQFGKAWEEETDIQKKEVWDTKANLGHEKVFEVRKHYNDLQLISEFFTQEFCDKHEFYEWKRYPNGEYRIESRDAEVIRKKLMARHINGGLPVLKLTEPNYRGRGGMLIQHTPDMIGRELYQPFCLATLESLLAVWQDDVYLASYNTDGEEIVYVASADTGETTILSREKFEAEIF